MTSIIQNSNPVDLVKSFIACTTTKDIESMRKIIHPKATACLIRKEEPSFKPLTEAIDALGRAEQELVEVSWDEVEQIDGEYATVWTKFSIHLDGKVSHSFSLGSATSPANPFCSFINWVQAHTRVGKARSWVGLFSLCQTSLGHQMIYLGCDSFNERIIALLLPKTEKYKPA
jgi:hypothetical protein